jgi:hypothetical protein
MPKVATEIRLRGDAVAVPAGQLHHRLHTRGQRQQAAREAGQPHVGALVVGDIGGVDPSHAGVGLFGYRGWVGAAEWAGLGGHHKPAGVQGAAYVNLSLDAATAGTYARLKFRDHPAGRVKFDRAVANLTALAQRRRPSGTDLEISVSFILYRATTTRCTTPRSATTSNTYTGTITFRSTIGSAKSAAVLYDYCPAM